jgi:hypothetical protein
VLPVDQEAVVLDRLVEALPMDTQVRHQHFILLREHKVIQVEVVLMPQEAEVVQAVLEALALHC